MQDLSIKRAERLIEFIEAGEAPNKSNTIDILKHCIYLLNQMGKYVYIPPDMWQEVKTKVIQERNDWGDTARVDLINIRRDAIDLMKIETNRDQAIMLANRAIAAIKDEEAITILQEATSFVACLAKSQYLADGRQEKGQSISHFIWAWSSYNYVCDITPDIDCSIKRGYYLTDKGKDRVWNNPRYESELTVIDWSYINKED